jgi:hypothetical protein
MRFASTERPAVFVMRIADCSGGVNPPGEPVVLDRT